MPRLVLVADDSPTHQRRAQGILTGEGLEVLTVSNGVAAIKKLPTIKPALILADISMPGRDGYEVCEFVKNSPDLTRVPVLLIYSDLEPYDESRAQRVRADGRIKKPFGQDELLAMVHRFLPEAEEAAPPPPPPKPAAETEPSFVTEPVDLAPEEATTVGAPDLGALSGSPAFAEQFTTEAALDLAPPAMSIEDELASREAAAAEVPAPEPPSMPDLPLLPEAASAAAEPMLVEESPETVPEPEPESASRTMVFRMPVQIAEPILADDLAPASAVAEAPVAPPEVPPPAAGEVTASTWESYTMADAAAGQVSIAPRPFEAPPPPPDEPAVAAPAVGGAPPPSVAEDEAPAPVAEAAVSSAGVVDTDLVYWIVHNVVVRMAPPALPTSSVEGLIRQITDEMINELTQPPPEPQT